MCIVCACPESTSPVPDDVAAEARAAGLNVSRVATAALVEELDRRAKTKALDAYLAQLGQASALTGKCAQGPTVEDQRHALRRRLAEG